ncbi:MAG: hypothetical protein MZV63_04550 [Marinilabiliales bacterium]|nr:hypothetical protein [Marinilabiliales bacterium]
MRDGLTGVTAAMPDASQKLIDTLHLSNPWFTPDNVRRAVSAIGNNLTHENLPPVALSLPETVGDKGPLTIGVVMAGNIPMVGFHDLLCVLITGNRLHGKTEHQG